MRVAKKALDYVINRSELEKYLFYYNVQTEEDLAAKLLSDYNLTLIINEKK